MLGVRLPEYLEKELQKLSEQTHRPKSYFVKEALKEYLENNRDYFVALQRLEKKKAGKSKTYSLEEMEKLIDNNEL